MICCYFASAIFMLQTKFSVNRGKWKKLSPLIWGLPSWDGGTIICLTPVIKVSNISTI
jgi:hypothetical protein